MSKEKLQRRYIIRGENVELLHTIGKLRIFSAHYANVHGKQGCKIRLYFVNRANEIVEELTLSAIGTDEVYAQLEMEFRSMREGESA